MAKCKTATWRGVTVCAHSVPYYEQFARETGSYLCTPIPGFGSYVVGKTASNGTSAGGGHVDFYSNRTRLAAAGLTPAELTAIARRTIGLAYDRPKLIDAQGNTVWGDHLHTEDPRCPNLSTEAARQFPRLEDGRSNLASNGPDVFDRTYVPRIMTLYRSRIVNAAKNLFPAIVVTQTAPTKPVSTGGTTVAQNKPSVWGEDVIDAPQGTDLKKNPKWTPASYLYWSYRLLQGIAADVKAIRVKLGA